MYGLGAFYNNGQDMLDIKGRIIQMSNYGKPLVEFITANIAEFEKSEMYSTMLTAQNYMKNKNDIKDRKRTYVGKNGAICEATALSNSKLSHPFMYKFVRQKVNYLLGKQFSVKTEDAQLAELLNEYFNEEFRNALLNVCKDAITNGIAWMQAYYDENGELKFKRIPATEVIPFWGDVDHTKLEAALRFYSQYYYTGTERKEIKRAEYYTKEGVWYFVDEGKGYVYDSEVPTSGHFKTNIESVGDNGEVVTTEQSGVWENIPLIAFKYNSDEMSLLTFIKSLSDDYDRNSSDTSNNIQDVPNSIKVVRNYDGTNKEDFMQNLQTFRMAFVSGDGSLDSLETKLDVAAIDSHLDRVRKDLYEFGSCVDTQEKDVGNLSGVAIEFRFSDLDIDCSGIANEFSMSLMKLAWFIKVHGYNSGSLSDMSSKFEIVFNKSILSNIAETIAAIEKSEPIVSQKTLLANHPWVTNVDEEIKQKQKDDKAKEEAIQKQQFGFGVGGNGAASDETGGVV